MEKAHLRTFPATISFKFAFDSMGSHLRIVVSVLSPHFGFTGTQFGVLAQHVTLCLGVRYTILGMFGPPVPLGICFPLKILRILGPLLLHCLRLSRTIFGIIARFWRFGSPRLAFVSAFLASVLRGRPRR